MRLNFFLLKKKLTKLSEIRKEKSNRNRNEEINIKKGVCDIYIIIYIFIIQEIMERNILSNGNNPVISLENYYLKEIHLQRLKDEDEAGQFGIKIGVDDSFEHINLIIKISTNEEVILVDMVGYFKFSDDIKLEEKEKFLHLNGAAILYPYIRAYISTITSFNKNGSAIIIPTVNFQQLYENYLKKKENNK